MILPSPSIAKDAARASKRIHTEQFHGMSAQTLTNLLGFSGFRVTHFYMESQGGVACFHLLCEHEHDCALCPCCLQPSVSGYDRKNRSVRHLDIFGKRTIIHFTMRRFDCLVCGKPFSEQLSWVDPKRHQTRAYEDYIYQRIQKTPRKHVALQEGLSESTVLDIFKKSQRTTTKGRSRPGTSIGHR